MLIVMSTPLMADVALAAEAIEIDLNVEQRVELTYSEIRETKKWTYDELERSITLKIPIKCVITPEHRGYTIAWEYGKAAILELVGPGAGAVPRDILSLTQNTAAAFGPIVILADNRGELQDVRNLPDIRKAIKAQYEKISDDGGSVQSKWKGFVLSAFAKLIELPDDALKEVVLAEIRPYFHYYGKTLRRDSLNIDEMNDPHPAFKRFKVRLVSEIDNLDSNKDLRVTRYQTDILDENGHERNLENHEPRTTWLTNVIFGSSLSVVKSFEDVREFESQGGKFKGRAVRKLSLDSSGLER